MVDKVTLEPNPDYYGALLFHRLMGHVVLDTEISTSKHADQNKGASFLSQVQSLHTVLYAFIYCAMMDGWIDFLIDLAVVDCLIH
jgi:hypothetical protein